MLLRRITEHVKAQNWFAVGIDFVIVVVGVFVGLQVSNWNAERAENAQLEQQLVTLRIELEDNLQRIMSRQLMSQSQIEDILEIRETLLTGDSKSDPGKFNAQLINVFRIGTWQPGLNAFHELTETGGLRRLNGTPLHTELIEWDESLSSLERINQDALTFRAGSVDYLMGALSFGPMVAQFEGVMYDDQFHNDPIVLAQDKKFDSYLSMRLGIEAQISFLLDQLKLDTKSVIEMLKAREMEP